MTLELDSIFMDAIEADAGIMGIIEGRRWCTCAPMPEEDFLDNVKVPYVIVNYNGFTNDNDTKDDPFEGDMDNVNISITMTANNREQLADLASRVRKAVYRYLYMHKDDEGYPRSAVVSGGKKFYDQWKPCYGIDLIWQCEVPNI